METSGVRALSANLVIVGGGLAGTCMALAAARHGTETILVHDRPVLGGNSSSEVRVIPAGSSHYNAWSRETGIVEELLLRDRARNHAQFFENGLTNRIWDLTLLEAVRAQERLTVFLNSTVRRVEVTHDSDRPTIASIHASQLTTERELQISGEQFADCTGDGVIAHLAGAEWRYGREARSEYDEPLAPVVLDRVTSGSTLSLHARDVGHPVPFIAPDWVEPYRSAADFGVHRELRGVTQPEFGGFWWLEVGSPYDQVTDTEEIRDEILRHLLGVWDYLKNHHPSRHQWDNYALDWFGMLPGKRESRRVVGDVVLSESDCHVDRAWPDRVGYGGWYIDLHIEGGILNRSEPGEPSFLDANYRNWTHVAPFSVPLRSLYSRALTNLWLGGRCLSATHVALGSLRVQQTLAALGHATGIAAAIALRKELEPRELATGSTEVLDHLRQRLLRDDVRVLGARNTDPTDLARDAVCTATSAAALDLSVMSDKAEPIADGRAQVIALTSNRLQQVRLHLVNPGPQLAHAEVTVSRLSTIWDRAAGDTLARREFTVATGFCGWVSVDLGSVSIPEPGPHRIALTGTPDLRWSVAQELPTGSTVQRLHRSDGGPEPANAGLDLFSPAKLALPAYDAWVQVRGIAHCLATEPAQRPFEAQNVVNGRPWPEDLPNLWISDPHEALPQAVTLSFPEARSFDTVVLTFDTDLDRRLGRAPGLWRAPQCAKTIHLEVRDGGGGWQRVRTLQDNYLRRRTIRLGEAVRTTAARITIDETNAPSVPSSPVEARLFEVRLYAAGTR